MAVTKMIAVFSVCHRAVWLLFTSVVLLSQVALLVTSYETAWPYMPEGSHFNKVPFLLDWKLTFSDFSLSPKCPLT
jgi:hypothetical protein